MDKAVLKSLKDNPPTPEELVKVPAHHCTVLSLAHDQDIQPPRTMEEIAMALGGIPVNTVKSRLNRARTRIVNFRTTAPVEQPNV